ncbi:periplasmic heavy metal sensor [Metapseudomonas otitidis]|uniref:periplasmic heavy metal sensor n=1 Tax=Metapseudomonas otitidis TaxID=319939 RepID=UPI003CEF4B63
MKRTGLLATALLLSLATNAFLVGWLIARPATPALAFGLQSQPMRQLMARVEALPDAQRSEVSAIISSHAPELRRLASTNRDNRRQLLKQLAADPLDRSAIESGFARQRQATGELQAAAQAMLLEIAERLPAEQRHQLLERPLLAR